MFHFGFARAGDRLSLRSVSYDDEVLVGEDDVAAEHATQATLVAKLSLPCK